MEIEFSERLLEERVRLRLSQEQFGSFGGVGKIAQYRYEAGERVPDGKYLAGIASAGADVLYLLLGKRTPMAEASLDAAEVELVNAYRRADKQGQQTLSHMASALSPAATALVPKKAAAKVAAKPATGMSNSGAGAIQIGHAGGNVLIKPGK